jgi:hypothetical protein
MAALIFEPQRLDALAAHPAGLALWLEAPPRGSLVERLHAYSRGYPARVQEALEDCYPAIAHILGAQRFAALAQRLAEAVPLRSYNLNDAGAALPRFLLSDPAAAHLPFLPDLARLEWHVARAFHARGLAPFDPAPLASWNLAQWEGAVVRFQPWVAVLRSEWPIRALWECRETPIDEIDLDLRDRPDCVLIHRIEESVVCESLAAAEADALGALLAGETLGRVVGELARHGGDPTVVMSWFSQWSGRGMIAACMAGI